MIRHSMIEYHFKEFLYNCISHTAHVILLFVLFLSTKHCLFLALLGLCMAILARNLQDFYFFPFVSNSSSVTISLCSVVTE